MKISAVFVFGFCCVFLTHGSEAAACRNTNKISEFRDISSDMVENDPSRTAYHFQPLQNWMNDPNGPMYYKGIHHLFYQYNPEGAVFGNMVWGHSASYDLVNWIHLGVALKPSEPYDINGCWSGSVTILPDNKPVILYTGGDANHNQAQNLAEPRNLSDLFLREWVKFPQNPVITLPNGVDGDKFRDPTTGWQGKDGTWRVVVGGQILDDGIAILYHSRDFVQWSKNQYPLYYGKRGMWECPDFFPVYVNSDNGVDTSYQGPNVKHVMKAGLAVSAADFYVLGTYDSVTDQFVLDFNFTGTSSDLRYDYGKFYASKTFFDSAKNRRIMWGWVNESDGTEDDIKKGWAGLQAIPRKVWLDKNGKQLIQWPIEEIETLRENEVNIFNKELQSGSILEVLGITASQAEAEAFDATWDDPQLLCITKDASVPSKFGPFGLLAFASRDLTEQTAIFFRVFKGKNRHVVLMCSDQSRSSLRNGIDKTTYGAFVDIDPVLEKISLRSLIDHSIVESFGGEGQTCITTRVYPMLAIGKDAHLYAFNNGTSGVVISRLSGWSMKNAEMQKRIGFTVESITERKFSLFQRFSVQQQISKKFPSFLLTTIVSWYNNAKENLFTNPR